MYKPPHKLQSSTFLGHVVELGLIELEPSVTTVDCVGTVGLDRFVHVKTFSDASQQ